MDIRTGRVTGRRTTVNKDGSEQERLMQVVVTDQDDVQTVQLVGQVGEESNPPDGSVVVLAAAGPALKIAVATLDRITPEMAVGGKRIYSTDEAGSTIQAEVRLDPDGTITACNPGATVTITPAGLVTIDADGGIVVNSDTTTINGDLNVVGTVTGSVDVVAAGISGKGHIHPENDSGGPTDPPI